MTRKKIKIMWLSANLFGYELLKEASDIEGVSIDTIVTLDPEAKTKMYDGIKKEKWYGFGIPVYEIKNINNEVKLFEMLKPDFIIMVGWRQIINKEILNLPQKGFIGFHPTLLPQGRGPAPLINTILSGWDKSGLTMFYINEGVDNGDIIGQANFDIGMDDYVQDIYDKMIEAGKKLIKKFLPLLLEDKAPRIPQDDSKATYLPKKTLKDNEINLAEESPKQIYRKIRALSKPYNGAYFKLKDKKLVIWQAELKNEQNN